MNNNVINVCLLKNSFYWTFLDQKKILKPMMTFNFYIVRMKIMSQKSIMDCYYNFKKASLTLKKLKFTLTVRIHMG